MQSKALNNCKTTRYYIERGCVPENIRSVYIKGIPDDAVSKINYLREVLRSNS